jgi:hypothetical protein
MITILDLATAGPNIQNYFLIKKNQAVRLRAAKIIVAGVGVKKVSWCKWTPEEDKIPIDNQPRFENSWSKYSELLPDWTNTAVSCRAAKIIVDKKIWEWTPEEDKILIDNHPHFENSWSTYSKLLSNQKFDAVSGCAAKIIVDKKGCKWTPEEDKILIDYSMFILAPAGPNI